MQAVTAFFVNLHGYVPICGHLSPAQVADLLSLYIEEVSDCVVRGGGTIVKYMGGQVMALWNAPAPQPDHATLATECALTTVAHTDVINQRLVSSGFPPIRYGIGISTGDVVVGNFGSTIHRQYDAIGKTVNTAALLSRAAGMEVLLCQQVREVVANHFVVREIEPLRTGNNQYTRLYQAIARRDETAAATAHSLKSESQIR